jgi:ubiquinone/menaquinone biosynthesis C-methylase UbiE
MTKFQNADYLKSQQYAGADKLAARIRLHERFSTNTVHVHRWEFDRILAALPVDAKVLEVGAGRGDLWVENKDRIPSGWHIALSDLSAGMLEDCKKHLGMELASRFSFEIMDVQSIPYSDASFDAVIANYMLYHVPDLPKAVAEIRRVLKPNGVLFAMTNGINHINELDTFMKRVRFIDSEGYGLMNVRDAFTTQNGAEKLRTQFDDVQLEMFDTALRVTELPPLMDYIASSLDDPDNRMQSPLALALWRELEQRIAEDGAIHITKETGLFTARCTTR